MSRIGHGKQVIEDALDNTGIAEILGSADSSALSVDIMGKLIGLVAKTAEIDTVVDNLLLKNTEIDTAIDNLLSGADIATDVQTGVDAALSQNLTGSKISDDVQTGVEAADISYKYIIEDAGTYIYYGWAAYGTATSAASWRIVRVESATGNRVAADGNILFDNVWDNRASLSYS